MTRQEAIEELERLLRHWDLIDEGIYDLSEHDQDAVEIAFTALRPVSREQVEKVWRGEWIIGEPDVLGVPIHCSRCGWGSDHADQRAWIEYKGHIFCGHCGTPMTDEAVQMVMERMEEMKNG